MSRYDYREACSLARRDEPFDALIMAAYLRADSEHQTALRIAFPALAAETAIRTASPGGILLAHECHDGFCALCAATWCECGCHRANGQPRDSMADHLSDFGAGWWR